MTPMQRWSPYLKERFPVGLNVLVAGLFAGTTGAAALASSGAAWSGAVVCRLGVAAAILFLAFLHLRIFDEHKDFANDVVSFPERVLSKGIMTLPLLRRLGMIVIPLEIGLAAVISWPFLVTVLAMIGFSVLMLREFFIADWLKRHMVLYGLSHMAILGIMTMVVYVSLQGVFPSSYDPCGRSLLAVTGMMYAFGYSLEISRKVRLPEMEKPGVDTYSKRFGIAGALIAVVICQCLALACLALSGLPVSRMVWGVVGLAELAVLVTNLRLGGQPDLKGLKRADGLAALPFLFLQIGLIATWGRG